MPDRIKITHQPKPMEVPSTKLTAEDILPGPLTESDLRQSWNTQADDYNNWDSLSVNEQLAWAQTSAIAALKAEPHRMQPTDQDLYDLAAEFAGDPVPAMRRALELYGAVMPTPPIHPNFQG